EHNVRQIRSLTVPRRGSHCTDCTLVRTRSPEGLSPPLARSVVTMTPTTAPGTFGASLTRVTVPSGSDTNVEAFTGARRVSSQSWCVSFGGAGGIRDALNTRPRVRLHNACPDAPGVASPPERV